MELIFLLLIISFIALRLFLNSPGYKGRSGERKIGNRLREFAGKSDGARCLHNIILYTHDGTTQIDHILVSETGIFVIETKNMSPTAGDGLIGRWGHSRNVINRKKGNGATC